MFVFLSFMRDPGTVIMLRCEDGDAALDIVAANRGADGADASRKRRVRPGDRNVNLAIIRLDGNRVGIYRGGLGYRNRLVLSVSEGVDHSQQLIGTKRR
jgi:hypothetical protein